MVRRTYFRTSRKFGQDLAVHPKSAIVKNRCEIRICSVGYLFMTCNMQCRRSSQVEAVADRGSAKTSGGGTGELGIYKISSRARSLYMNAFDFYNSSGTSIAVAISKGKVQRKVTSNPWLSARFILTWSPLWSLRFATALCK
jgi:hypothetical protein